MKKNVEWSNNRSVSIHEAGEQAFCGYIYAYTDIIQVWVSPWVIWERARQHARCWWLLLMKCPFLVSPYACWLTLIVLFLHIQCWMVRHLVYVWMSVLSFDSEPFAIHWHSCFAWIMYLRWYISPLIIIVIVIIPIVFVNVMCMFICMRAAVFNWFGCVAMRQNENVILLESLRLWPFTFSLCRFLRTFEIHS